MTEQDKENMPDVQSLQVVDALKKGGQLPTPTSSRETSRVRPQPISGQILIPSADQQFQVEQTGHLLQIPSQHVQPHEQQQQHQQPVKRKRGRPRKRPLPPPSGFPHVKVQVVPTPAQAEHLRQHGQTLMPTLSRASSPATEPRPVDVVTPYWQNPRSDYPNGVRIGATLPALTPTNTAAMIPDFHAVPHPPNAHYPPDISSQWPPDQPSSRYPPLDNPPRGSDGMLSRGTQAQAASADEVPEQIEVLTKLLDDLKNVNSTASSRVNNTGIANKTLNHNVVSKGQKRKRHPRPSLKVRENAAQKGEREPQKQKEAEKQRNNADADIRVDAEASPRPASKTIHNTKETPRKARKHKSEGRAAVTPRANHQPPNPSDALPENRSLITNTAMNHRGPASHPRLRSESLTSKSGLFINSPSGPQPQAPPNSLPEHVQRWRDLGFPTFPTGELHPMTGDPEHRVVIRQGGLKNTPAFWLNVAIAKAAEHGGPKEDKATAEVRISPLSEVVGLLVNAREEGDQVKLEQEKRRDCLLKDVTRRAKTWKRRRRSRWESATWAVREVRLRRASRGDFVGDEDGEGAMSDVLRAGLDEEGNARRPEGLRYRRARDGTAPHWMKWEEIKKVTSAREVLRSKVAEVEMQEGQKTKIKMAYARMQDSSQSRSVADLDSLHDLEDRLDGIGFWRKSQLQKAAAQIDDGSHYLKPVSKSVAEARKVWRRRAADGERAGSGCSSGCGQA